MDLLSPIWISPIPGYDKSPDYGAPVGRWTALAWLVGIVAVAVGIALYAAGGVVN